MALSTLIKTVNVTPLSAPLDSGVTTAGVVSGLGPGAAGMIVDGQPTHGSPTGDAALVQAHNALLQGLVNMALTAAGTTTATTTSKVKTANTLTYLIDGVFKSKGATDNFWTLTGSAVTAGGSGATMHYALCINSAGAASVIQGPTNQTSTTVWTPAPANLMAADICICATLLISLTATTTFTPGTTAVSTSGGVTVTFEDGMDATLWGSYLLTATRI